tara:strand:+ start:249 stop:368 length:120 start_codon:yes stop_codon:yes gene_type:complete
MWIYETKAGTYKEDSLIKLLVTIYKHRFHHLVNDGKWID